MKLKPQTCPFCTGRTVRDRKTLYLYPSSNRYWCARCKASGSIDDIDIELEIGENRDYSEITSYNNQGGRFSVCRQRDWDGYKDIFQIKYPNGEQVGNYIRLPDKISRINGKRGFGYREEFLDFTKVYRVVEGPYDCIYPNDICTFGIPTETQARLLKPYKLVLTPDGDIWKNTESVLQWVRPFRFNNVLYVERLPNDKDPDEIQEKEREILQWQKIKKFI